MRKKIDTDNRGICELQYIDNIADGIYYAEITAYGDVTVYSGF